MATFNIFGDEPTNFFDSEPRDGRWWIPEQFSRTEGMLWDDFAIKSVYNDPVAQALFHSAYFDQSVSQDDRAAIRDALNDYMADEYNIEFQEVFDWDTWRENYEGGAE